jgi:GAF domain-containing protein
MEQTFTNALAAAVRSIGRAETVDGKLGVIVETLAVSLPRFSHVGISTLESDGTIRTRAQTSQLVLDLDRLQYELGEGPCFDTMKDAWHLDVPAIASDGRWPRFVPHAVELGLKSQIAVRLFVDEAETIGSLNLYSVDSEDIDPDAIWVADLFANQAALVLGESRESDHLRQALETRQLIGQATGLMMARYGLDDQAAFGFLARTSSHANLKLREVAARLVSDHLRDPRAGVS